MKPPHALIYTAIAVALIAAAFVACKLFFRGWRAAKIDAVLASDPAFRDVHRARQGGSAWFLKGYVDTPAAWVLLYKRLDEAGLADVQNVVGIRPVPGQAPLA
jgi:hypothetical protein